MSTDYTKSLYGDDRLIEFAVPCSYCNGGHAVKVRESKRNANIPHSFYDSMLEDFKWDIYRDEQQRIVSLEKHKEIVTAFINDFATFEKYGVGLYIYSKMKGSGKTFLASCICNELIAKYPMNTKFVRAAELIDIQKSGTDSYGSKYDKDPIQLLCDCKLLVIDDLGQKQTGTEWTSDILFRILDNRMQNKLVTIITSNIEIQSLQLDDRIVDRVNKICQPIPLPEYCVRSRTAYENKLCLFQELGILNKAEKENV